MVTTVMRICSACQQEKPISMFARNGQYTYSICKACKKLRMAARRYDLTIKQVKVLYDIEKCMCCNLEFSNSRMQHIHHTKDGYQGVVCQYCNHILRQETSEDLQRIEACLRFMNQPRKNLFNRDNPQGRPLSVPSTTTRPARFDEQICQRCKQTLPLTAFRIDRKWRRKTCQHCEVCLQSARVFNLAYEEVYQLYSRQICDCCQLPFTSQDFASIHHIDDRVLGVVCNYCNKLLGQETATQRKRLKACATWIKTMMI